MEFSVVESSPEGKAKELKHRILQCRLENKNLQLSLAGMRLDLEALRDKRVRPEMIENLKKQIAELKKTERLILNIPKTPEECGQLYGTLVRKKYELQKNFPEMKSFPYTPEPGTPRHQAFLESYDDYIHDCIAYVATPIRQDLQKNRSSPDARRKLALLLTTVVVNAVRLRPEQVPSVRAYYERHMEREYEGTKRDPTVSGEVPSLETIDPFLDQDQLPIYYAMGLHKNTTQGLDTLLTPN